MDGLGRGTTHTQAQSQTKDITLYIILCVTSFLTPAYQKPCHLIL